VDDVRRRLSRTFRERRFEKFSILDGMSGFARWPMLLLQWVFSLIYFSAAMEKLLASGIDWMNGYTLQYFLVRDGLRWNTELGVWLGQHHTIVMLLSIFTIVWEGIFFLVLIFPRMAYVFVPLGLAFHTGIYLTMRAPFFQWLSVYTVFFPWDRITRSLSRRVGWLRTPGKTEVFYDGKCPLCLRSMTLLSYFDWFGRLTYVDVVQHWPELVKRYPEIPREEYLREMFVLSHDGSLRRGFFAFREIFKQLPPLWPLLVLFYLPMASTVGPRIYEMIASRRMRYEKCSFETCVAHNPGTEQNKQ
jgi:predicted DCC family thiol-disulfide oxidoreductase YuxK